MSSRAQQRNRENEEDERMTSGILRRISWLPSVILHCGEDKLEIVYTVPRYCACLAASRKVSVLPRPFPRSTQIC